MESRILADLGGNFWPNFVGEGLLHVGSYLPEEGQCSTQGFKYVGPPAGEACLPESAAAIVELVAAVSR
jgi:hypothetical protein